MTTIQKNPIVLNAPRDWEVWIDMIQNRAKVANVWKYIDPETPKENLPILTRPAPPTARDVNPAKTLISELTPIEVEELKSLREDRKDRNREYERQQSAIRDLHTLIHETVSRFYYTYLLKKETLHDMIVALKLRIAPTDRAREIELTNQYQKLKKVQKTQNIDEWLKTWETTYTNCMEYQIPEIAKSRLIYDFLQAVKDVAPDFTGYWKVRIQSSEQLGEKIPDVYQLLEHFRNHIRIENAENAQMTHGAFGASFQGQQLDKKEDEKKEKEYKPCLCGKKHRFKTCWYLIEILRPAEWKPDPEIEKQIKEKLEKSSKLRDIIERIRKQVTSKKEEGKSQKPATFMTSVFNSELSTYMLCKSVILDSGAIIHVYNNCERFQSLRLVGKEEFIYAGNTTIPIEGFENAIITINTLEG